MSLHFQIAFQHDITDEVLVKADHDVLQVYFVFAIVFWEGLLGGLVYVSTYARVREEVVEVLVVGRWRRSWDWFENGRG